MHYYNDFEEFAARWLENLIAANYLPAGRVDRRSILNLRSSDLRDYRQCHFFAGIGGWSLALRIAGWPLDRPVWTGSCPCQPFSDAGRRKGFDDERHLWPVWLELIRECLPPTIFGEQVASKTGRLWLAGVRSDLEALGYAVAAADLCAAGVSSPHIRQRLWWGATRLGHSDRRGSSARQSAAEAARHWLAAESDGRDGRLADAPGERFYWRKDSSGEEGWARTEDGSWLGDPGHTRLERWSILPERPDQWSVRTPGLDYWDRFELTPCWDGKTRRFESESFPLAHGISTRVGLLRAYGNAIVPQLAAVFVRSFMDVIDDV